MLLLVWSAAIIGLCILWYLLVRGYVINLVGLLKALPGIVADVFIQIGLSIVDAIGLLNRRKMVDGKGVDEHDIYK